MYDHVRLLRVSLTEAPRLFECFEDDRSAAQMRQLSHLVFIHEWCYRPFEMTAAWVTVERKGKPRHRTEPWCVWGFAQPEVPGVCHVG